MNTLQFSGVKYFRPHSLLFIVGILTSGLLGLSPSYAAATCQKTTTQCVDTTSSKVFSGVTVTLAEVGGCWKYEDSYNCVNSVASPVDYCAPLIATSSCYQTSSTCAQTAFNGDCLKYTNVYRCGSSTSSPANTVVLDNTYTIVKDALNTTACAVNEGNSLCTLAEQTCTEGASTKIINGLAVTKDCWTWDYKYACRSPDTADSCAGPIARGCTQKGNATCVDGLHTNADDAACTAKEFTYQCLEAAATHTEQTTCGSQKYCVQGNCEDLATTGDSGFGKTTAIMTAMKEANEDIGKGIDIFKGKDQRCEKEFTGILRDCCDMGGILSGVVACGESDKSLAKDRKSHLCTGIGSYCSNWLSAFGERIACLARTETYCCFNSKLARIIHEQGRGQLGWGWGDAESPNCQGMKAEDMQKLDFSKIDFSEFYADIKAKTLSSEEAKAKAQNKVSSSVGGGL